METPVPVDKKTVVAGTVLKGRWKLVQKVGQGAFGEIFSGNDQTTLDPVAVKLERWDSKKAVLKMEVRVYLLNPPCSVPPRLPPFSRGNCGLCYSRGQGRRNGCLTSDWILGAREHSMERQLAKGIRWKKAVPCGDYLTEEAEKNALPPSLGWLISPGHALRRLCTAGVQGWCTLLLWLTVA